MVVTLLALLSLMVLGETPGQAAFPGNNGRIAFVATRNGNTDIYAIDADGTDETRLTSSNEVETDPAWSPDGSKIAFRKGDDGIFVVNSDGTNPRRVLDESTAFDPAWSPDGMTIAFLADDDDLNEIFVMDADGTNVRQVTDRSDDEALDYPEQPSDLSWSPDGQRFAFEAGSRTIFVMPVDGSAFYQLTCTWSSRDPSWSPDGGTIAYEEANDIYLMDADGSDHRPLVNDDAEDADDLAPAWSPDGTKVAFSSSRGGVTQLYVVNADGSARTRLAATASSSAIPSFAGADPDWQPVGNSSSGATASSSSQSPQSQESRATCDAPPAESPPPTSEPLRVETVGELQVGAVWRVPGLSTADGTFQWIRCRTREEPSSCSPIAMATGATYRIAPADHESFIAVQFSRTSDGASATSAPSFVLFDACEPAIEIHDGHFYKTRTRASMSIPPRPGFGCVRMNLFIAAKHIGPLNLGDGDDREASRTATATDSRASVWMDFEAGRIDVVSNHTSARRVVFNASRTNVALNPDAMAARAMSGCVERGRLDWDCIDRKRARVQFPNHLGVYESDPQAVDGALRLRYHFTNAIARNLDYAAPAPIDGILGFEFGDHGAISITCVHRDEFPSIEIYHERPSHIPGRDAVKKTLYKRGETRPGDLEERTKKETFGDCGRIERPPHAIDNAAILESYAGIDPYQNKRLLRHFKPWAPM